MEEYTQKLINVRQYKKTVAMSNVPAGPIPIYEYFNANNYFFFNMTCQVQDYDRQNPERGVAKITQFLAFITKLL